MEDGYNFIIIVRFVKLSLLSTGSQLISLQCQPNFLEGMFTIYPSRTIILPPSFFKKRKD